MDPKANFSTIVPSATEVTRNFIWELFNFRHNIELMSGTT